MNKLIAVLVLSSALLATAADTASPATPSAATPALTTAAGNSNAAARKITMNASLRSKCLTTVANLLTANLKACKDRISNPKFTNCKQTAYNIAKMERGACPTAKSSLK